MAVALASLRVEASLDASKYAAGAKQVSEANRQLATSEQTAGAAIDQTEQKVVKSAASLEKLKRAIDPVYRAEQQMASAQGQLKRALDAGQISLDEYNRRLAQAEQRYRALDAAQTRGQVTVGSSIAHWKALGAAMAIASTSVAVRDYIQLADTMTNLSARIRLVAGSSVAAAGATDALFEAASRSRVSAESLVSLYARLGRSAGALGIDQERLIAFTETFGKALKISGASTAEANSTILQFSQSMASGRVGGAELNAVLEAGGRAAQALADGLGVPIGALKELGEQGKLTAIKAFGAIESQRGAIEREFSQLPLTVSDALTQVNNDILRFTGRIDASAGASRDLAKEVKEFSNLLNNTETVKAGITVVTGLASAFNVVAASVTGVYGAIRDLGILIKRNKEAFDIIGGLAGPGVAGAGAGYVASAANDNMSVASAPHDNRRAGARALADRRLGDERALVAQVKEAERIAADKRKDEAERQAKASAQRQQGLDKYLTGLDSELKLSQLTGRARAEEEAILRATAIVQRNLTATEEQRVRLTVEQRFAFEEQNKLLERQRENTQRLVDDLKGETKGFFASAITGDLEGALDRAKDRLVDFLAEMAAEALANPIIIPLVASLVGASGTIGAGGAAGSSGGGSSGVSGLGGLSGGLGAGLTKDIDKLGRSLGFQTGGPEAPYANDTGIFGTNTYASDVAGGGLAGLGVGSAIGTAAGGKPLGSAIGGLLGGIAGSFLGPIGSLIGGALGGVVGGMFGNGPSNQTGNATFNARGQFTVGGAKSTSETRGAVGQAANAVTAAIDLLTQGGDVTLTQQLERLQIGTRDKSTFQFAGGKVQSSGTVGDPAELALAVVKSLASSADYSDKRLRSVLTGNNFGSLDELTRAVAFTRDVYGAIVDARPGLTQVEQEMKSLRDSFAAARKEAEKLGLSVEDFDIGARKTFDRSIGDQIRAITDPVGLALDEFERSAKARVDTARTLGADLVEVEKLNALQRAQVLAQASVQSYAGLKSLIQDIAFGGLSAAAPDAQYFSALTNYNTAKRAALESGDAGAIGEFESASRSLLPVARSFLGTSTAYGALQADVVDTARQIGGSYADPAAIGAAIVAAQQQSGAAIVDQLVAQQAQIATLVDEVKRLNAALLAAFQHSS